MGIKEAFPFVALRETNAQYFAVVAETDLCWLRTNAAGANDVCVVVMSV